MIHTFRNMKDEEATIIDKARRGAYLTKNSI